MHCHVPQCQGWVPPAWADVVAEQGSPTHTPGTDPVPSAPGCPHCAEHLGHGVKAPSCPERAEVGALTPKPSTCPEPCHPAHHAEGTAMPPTLRPHLLQTLPPTAGLQGPPASPGTPALRECRGNSDCSILCPALPTARLCATVPLPTHNGAQRDTGRQGGLPTGKEPCPSRASVPQGGGTQQGHLPPEQPVDTVPAGVTTYGCGTLEDTARAFGDCTGLTVGESTGRERHGSG